MKNYTSRAHRDHTCYASSVTKLTTSWQKSTGLQWKPLRLSSISHQDQKTRLLLAHHSLRLWKTFCEVQKVPTARTDNSYMFMQWYMDIIRPLVESRGKKKVRYILVITDYFTKWIETDSYQRVKSVQVKDFIWKNIACHHGLPYQIITDNGS